MAEQITIQNSISNEQPPDTATSSHPNHLSELQSKFDDLVEALSSDETPPLRNPKVKALLRSISEHALWPPSHQLSEDDYEEWEECSGIKGLRLIRIYCCDIGNNRELKLYPVADSADNRRAGKRFSSSLLPDDLITYAFKLMLFTELPLKLQILKYVVHWLEDIGEM
tara:strand:+ start:3793 stop:4296 length:504 start_codon:yes stop_codon:yes gene_type:complete